MTRSLTLLATALVIAGCASVVPRAPSTAPATSGKYYLDDGPGLNPPADLDSVPDAVPRLEALHRAANRPYAVLGREYVPATTLTPYDERRVRQERDRARQRPRAVPARSHHRPVVCGRASIGHRPGRQRRSRRRGDPARCDGAIAA